MSQAVRPTTSEYAKGTVVLIAMNTALGAIAALAFTPFPPLGGAIFGATSSIGSHAVNWVLDKAGIAEDSLIGAVAKFAISFFAGIGIGALITTAIGFPITFTAGLILTAMMLGTALTITLLIGSCLSSSFAGTALTLDTE